jgi:hypothetical protein
VWDVIEIVGHRLQFPPASETNLVIGHAALILSLGIAVFVLERRIATTTRSLQGLTRAANVGSLALVLFAGFRIAQAHFDVGNEAASLDRHELPRQSSEEEPRRDAASRPDIYYLIFDRYANASTLRDAYHFDNGPFLKSLEDAGFYVASASRCNYPLSLLSLSSSLNMQYHEPQGTMGQVAERLPKGHEVGKALKDHGYRYIHVWGPYLPTSACQMADVNLRPRSGISRSTAEFSFPLALVRMTPLGVLFKETIDAKVARQHAEAALWQFEALRSLPAEPGPKFVFAHFLLPHPPLAFTARGLRWGRPEPSGSKQGYLEQLQYTNARIAELVKTLLAESAEPPIIVLQADEGPYLREDDFDKPLEEQRAIRTGILNAYHVPDAMRPALSPEMSPVNTFRLILSEQWGTELELLEDRILIWPDMQEPGEGEDPDDLKAKRIAYEGREFPEPDDDQPFQFQDVTAP